MKETIGVISLGCAKNQVNAEQMMYLLQEAGYQIQENVLDADVAIINTCGFIESAKAEAISHILQCGELKKAGKIGKLLVTGCLSQRYQEEILKEMPEVDGVLGTGNYFDIVKAVEALLQGQKICQFGSIDDDRIDNVSRVLTTPTYYAYLKIAEGCDNHCAYCVIPSLRGAYRSRPMEELLYEARMMAESGVKELIVVAQDTSRYGLDLYGKRMLSELLRQLCQIEGIVWVRVHYLYPDEISQELIQVIATEPKITKYLDIPIQHVNDKILQKMNRRGNKAYLDQLLKRLRQEIPGLVLRTSLITGLPGEGEEEFSELCEFLKEHHMERVGAFAFSPEEGTPAYTMEYPDTEIAQQRAEIIEELQSRIMDQYNADMMGQRLMVLCEGYDAERGAYYGRSFAESPDVDGRVWIYSDEIVPEGTFVTILVDGALDGELMGRQAEVLA